MNTLPTDNPYELNISRLVNVSPEALYRGWTEPELLVQWFVPRPWKTTSWEIDLRPGGVCNCVMQGPDGEEFPNVGVFLEVLPNRKLVFTDAFKTGWIPTEQAFMTGEITFEPDGDQTRYTARVYHWNAADRDKHIEMGFYEGWNKCLDQLVELCQSNP